MNTEMNQITKMTYDIYDKIDTKLFGLTKNTFSQYYLGKSLGYFSYTKSTNENISVTAGWHLHNQLLHEELSAAENAGILNNQDPESRIVFQDRKEFFRDLKDKVLQTFIAIAYEEHEMKVLEREEEEMEMMEEEGL